MILDKLNEETYKEFVKKHRPNSLRFEDSWQYIRQATRLHFEAYIKKYSLAILSKHPKYDLLMAVNIIGDFSILDDIKEDLLIKNVNPIEKHLFQQKGFRELSQNEYWSLESPYDDQTYPQQIIDTNNTVKLKGKFYSELRRETNKLKENHLQVRPYSLEDRTTIEKLLEKQDNRNPGTYEAHQMYLEVTKGAKIYTLNNKIVAYSLIDEISPLCIAANAFIYDTDKNYLPGNISCSICKNTRHPFLNLQGSEKKSLDKWKRKFNPVISIKNTHLIRK